jgi:hypothetical protein
MARQFCRWEPELAMVGLRFNVMDPDDYARFPEFGDDPHRYTSAKARKNYAGSSPITRASGRKSVVLARHVRNRRLADALHAQAFSALRASPGARAYYDALRARGIGHHAALRQLSNRLVGILHGCLKTRTLYDEHTAWAHHQDRQKAA